MPNPNGDSARRMLVDSLLRRIEADQYPSSTMLDMVEALLSDDEVESYAEMLIEKIDADLYPSIPLIQRVMALA